MRRLDSKRAPLLLGVIVLALSAILPQLSNAAKKRHARSAGGCQATLVPASGAVRPLGNLFVSGKVCAKGKVKLQQAAGGSWLGLGRTTAGRSGAFSSCVVLRDAAGASSLQLRAVGSDGSKALATVQLSGQGTDSCSPTPVPTSPATPPATSQPPTTTLPTTTTPPPTNPPPTTPPPTNPPPTTPPPTDPPATDPPPTPPPTTPPPTTPPPTTPPPTTPPPTDPPPTTPGPTTPPPTTPPPSDVPAGLRLLKEDLATEPDPMALWGDIDAVSPTRHQWLASGGPDGGPFRRMTARDGDLYHGDSERAELGNSSYQLTSLGKLKTFFLYHEGDRRVTSYWMRLPTDFPLNDMENWQVVMQMKQSEPANNADGTPVISLQAIEGNWILKQSSSSGLSESTRYIWTTPAKVGDWTHIVVDATYSSDPTKGLFQITIGGVASPVLHSYNLKKETSPAGPGLRVGESIPSHLRLGIYHDPVMPGTSVDVADVQIFG